MRGGEQELTCQELVELVTEYLEGSLPADDRRRFEDHLRRCDGCEAHLAQMRKTLQVVGQLKEDDIAPEARDRLLAAFRSWRQTRS